ncbi:hypothetical protein TNCV_1210661 [Trichonephila clavipes]|nr:hypothetical protein TNCV_1210661 [Trichonephila clavipes]
MSNMENFVRDADKRDALVQNKYSSTSTYGLPIYSNAELRDFQISSIRLLFEEKKTDKIGEIDKVIKAVVDLAKQIDLKVYSNDVQELLDSHYQYQTIDELIEMS